MLFNEADLGIVSVIKRIDPDALARVSSFSASVYARAAASPSMGMMEGDRFAAKLLMMPASLVRGITRWALPE